MDWAAAWQQQGWGRQRVQGTARDDPIAGVEKCDIRYMHCLCSSEARLEFGQDIIGHTPCIDQRLDTDRSTRCQLLEPSRAHLWHNQ